MTQQHSSASLTASPNWEALLRESAHLLTASTDTPIWQPDKNNKPQQLAYASKADVLGYGGAAGGGKTDFAIGAALTKHRSSIIFRREYPQLKDILQRAVEVVGTDDGLNRNEGTFKNLPGNRRLEFGSMQYEENKSRYKGRPKDLMVFDEATEFTESQVRFVKTWNRTTVPGQKCQTILTFNPPTDMAGEWVIDYFAPWLDEDHPNPAEPGELRWFVSTDDGDLEVPGPEPYKVGNEILEPESRTFIPARVEDNQYLMASGYTKTLDNLPPELRRIMRHGIMSKSLSDAPLQLIPREWVIQAQKRWEDFHASGDPLGVPLTQTGADVSRGGKDRTVIANRYGTYFAEPFIYQGEVTSDGLKVSALILKHNDGIAPIAVDAIGVGTSAFDHLKENHPNVLPLNGNEKSGVAYHKHEYAYDKSGKYKLANKRTEWHWRFMEALDPVNGEGLMIPPGAELRKQICAPRYKLTPGGVRIELKDDIKKRLGESPDLFEALLYAWAEVSEPEPKRRTASVSYSTL